MRIPLLRNASTFARKRLFSSCPATVKPVTHCIFDMDGLLLDTETVYAKMITKLCKKYGHDYSNDLMLKILGGTEWRMAEILVKELKLPVTPSELRDEFLIIGDTMLANAPWMPGAKELLCHLHQNNIPIACATSSSDRTVKVKVQGHEEVFSFFNHWVMGSTDPEVKYGKPHPDIFLIAAARFPDKPDPSKCLVFEDSPHGVTAANKAGMQSVMVPDPHLDPKLTTHATIVLPTLEKFKPELFSLPPYCVDL